MDFFTAAVLSGAVYDLTKRQIKLTADNLKNKLSDWLLDDKTASTMASGLDKLQLSDELSEIAIERRIEKSEELVKLMNTIKPNNTTITQTHSGSGDNVAGNKTINH